MGCVTILQAARALGHQSKGFDIHVFFPLIRPIFGFTGISLAPFVLLLVIDGVDGSVIQLFYIFGVMRVLQGLHLARTDKVISRALHGYKRSGNRIVRNIGHGLGSAVSSPIPSGVAMRPANMYIDLY